ncbi:hypothetical protein SIID45300_00295 [Candidatus Magnetaquicoccaceae bacterium FCR-1]|uniref:Uncharacterized protein n=1 Tax=Candidatus Magnetaquiglobus chichijimensis TaxID=3141448 RepID=A0ABQ0C531_9PROT
MRILIFLTLGVATLFGLVYGIGMIWRSLHPASAPEPLPVPSWLEGRVGGWLAAVVVASLLGLALEDLLTTRKDPGEHQPPPRLTAPAPKGP